MLQYDVDTIGLLYDLAQKNLATAGAEYEASITASVGYRAMAAKYLAASKLHARAHLLAVAYGLTV